MAVRRLNHAVLYVRDLARTVSFYRETLGFEVRTEVPGRAAFLGHQAPPTIMTSACSRSTGRVPRRRGPMSASTTWPGK